MQPNRSPSDNVPADAAAAGSNFTSTDAIICPKFDCDDSNAEKCFGFSNDTSHFLIGLRWLWSLKTNIYVRLWIEWKYLTDVVFDWKLNDHDFFVIINLFLPLIHFTTFTESVKISFFWIESMKSFFELWFSIFVTQIE